MLSELLSFSKTLCLICKSVSAFPCFTNVWSLFNTHVITMYVGHTTCGSFQPTLSMKTMSPIYTSSFTCIRPLFPSTFPIQVTVQMPLECCNSICIYQLLWMLAMNVCRSRLVNLIHWVFLPQTSSIHVTSIPYLVPYIIFQPLSPSTLLSPQLPDLPINSSSPPLLPQLLYRLSLLCTQFWWSKCWPLLCLHR